MYFKESKTCEMLSEKSNYYFTLFLSDTHNAHALKALRSPTIILLFFLSVINSFQMDLSREIIFMCHYLKSVTLENCEV